jgi:hypothetical protein
VSQSANSVGAAMPADIAVVVLSCDRYRDLWPPFFELFFRHWHGCRYPIYLFANEASYPDERVRTIQSGTDHTWSDSIKRCLEKLTHRHVWLLFDDVFLAQPVEEGKLALLEAFVAARDPDYLRFRKYPRPDERIDRYFGRCREGVLYRTSILAIWKRVTLVELLDGRENAWEFEHSSVGRSTSYPGFYGVYDEYLHHVHGVEKGVWTRDAVSRLRRMAIEPDLSSRPQMNDAQHAAYCRSVFRTMIFNRTPSLLKPVLVQGSRLLRGCFVGTG